ncbi:17956_t:CDS:1 [Funneliformis geosporum]|uniref:3899_t:CDS:1 n=1 Tax=Funneliformis geosporum TaxID=1117311 RepID=A0A9W4SIN3_9GLOM|nr:17956_t:CDS:1 [Funneliformis geosporum]CAI2168408.1 3899_t:CDS:1 [Funneliformis geosporum]
MPSQVINHAQPFIKPPFPPSIEPRDLLKKGILCKAPNAFIIYRKVFITTARSDGYNLPMTVISSMASQSWEQEPDDVKAEYKRIAKETFNLRNDMLPKSVRRRKREKWNIVSFEDNVEKFGLRNESIKIKSKTTKHKKSASKDSLKVPRRNELPLSPVSSPEPISTEPSPIITPEASPLILPKVSSRTSHSLFVNYNCEELTQCMIPSPKKTTFDEAFGTERKNWLQSPESSIGSPESDKRYLIDFESPTPLFVEPPMISQFDEQIDLMLDQSSQQFNLGINSDNLFNEIYSDFLFDVSTENRQSSNLFPSQNFLTTEFSYYS